MPVFSMVKTGTIRINQVWVLMHKCESVGTACFLNDCVVNMLTVNIAYKACLVSCRWINLTA